ncbi:membrane protein, transporter-related [gamma proteobacterium HdN1]|nr:membrane protein, transporter-related [gamma proteobacterium HdN1]
MLPKRSLREWISSLPVLTIMLLVMTISINEKVYSQLLVLGEHMFGDYYLLRGDNPKPSCDVNQNIDVALKAEVEKQRAALANDEFGGLFGSDVDEGAIRKSLEGQIDLCKQKHSMYELNQEKVTPAVRAFRLLDYGMLGLAGWGRDNAQVILLALIFVCVLTATFTNHHISLRALHYAIDYRVSAGFQFAANIALAYSSWGYLEVGYGSGVAILNEHTRWGYLIVFSIMSLFTLSRVFIVPKDAPKGGSFGKAILSVPLYVFLTLGSANYFLLLHSNTQGLVLYVDKMMDVADLFTKIALFIWAGLLLKQTYIGELVFRIFKPWQMPAELLACFAIFLMAVPTAYTGASGAIIVAMGGVIYTELRRAGARRNLALAATAMTGSLGVVLRPCLLVLIIAVLNKEVTTDILFTWGTRVFLMTSVIFLIVAIIAREGSLKVAPARDALVPSLRAFIPLIPYAIIIVTTVYFFRLVLNVQLDEHSAATIIPVAVFLIVIYEKLIGKPHEKLTDAHHDEDRQFTVEGSVRQATTATSELMGGLLILIALSMAFSGVVEESHIIQSAADQGDLFHNIWTATTALIVLLTLIGMSGLEPFGAVILVSGSVAQVAYKFGIDPVHFWMLVLISFEMAFLAPVIGLNHLLTRHTVGEKETDIAREESRDKSFWYRNERYLFPITVMFISMLLVGYGPIIYKEFIQ